ncbi:MAG: GrpB family protein, partial [Rhodothermales bacterium]|nr:GrpB family protein [Rhodothermales bacterium]
PTSPSNRAEVDEPVEVVPYDPAWPVAFEAEREALTAALGSAAVAVEHFGSTAVPGLAAKPVVDVLVGLRSYPPPARALAALARLGYEDLGEAGVPSRHYCRKRPAEGVAFNAALVLYDGPVWADNLAVRDYLRAHPAEAEQYAAVKRASAGPAVRLLAYSDRKGPFVTALAARARGWVGSGAA